MTSTTRLPDPKPCEHCGKQLAPRTFELCGHTLFFGWEPCDCEGFLMECERAETERKTLEESSVEADLRRRVERSGIPPRYRDATHEWAQRLANRVEEGKSFYIHGKNGTGKTKLACAAGLLYLKRGKSVEFWVATKLLDLLREFSSEAKEVSKRLEECDLLIIDDFGKEGAATPRAAEKLFDIVNDRYNADTTHDPKPVIITSNFERGKVASKVSEGGAGIAIASRLAEMTMVVHLDGEDRRIANGKDRHVA